jgi:hypothetical protein
METILRSYAWNLTYAGALVADLAPADWTTPAGPGLENHPAWTLGHLVTGSAILAEDLGLERDLPGGWADLFERRGPGDPRLPITDPGVYPPGPAILTELGRQHARVDAAVRALPAARLAEPVDWRLAGALPTLADLIAFLALSHETMHLGQLAGWRRARGLPSALAAL